MGLTLGSFGRATSILVLLATASCARPVASGAGGFAFVLLGEGADGQPMPIVRSVTEGAAACPRLEPQSGAPVPMTARQRPPQGGFDDVLVCEARYPVGTAASVVVNGKRIALPAVSLDTPRRVVLFGDTGCEKGQACDGADEASWAFAAVAQRADLPSPDLIVHVGDYNYRGTPRAFILPSRATGYASDMKVLSYDAGDGDEDEIHHPGSNPAYWSQNVPGSPVADGWPAWRDDFFVPAARLLPAAPWVFLRGNHELCSRAGPGWFYLLDPASPLLGAGKGQQACPPQLPADWRPGAWPKPPAQPFVGQPIPSPTSAPYRLRLGGLNLVAIDSSNAGDAFPYNTDVYEQQYRAVAGLLSDRTPTWIVTHRPLWGIVTAGEAQTSGVPYAVINVTQEKAVATVFPSGLPPHVTAVLAGHIHRFQAIGFLGRRPPQLVVGTGGVELDKVVPRPAPSDPLRPVPVANVDGMNATVVGLKDFGVMVLMPGPGGDWTADLLAPGGRELATCDSAWHRHGGPSVCALK